jgi:hypothetical protein
MCANWWEHAYALKGYEVHYDASTVEGLKGLIFSRGPVATTMQVYSDFYSYRKGDYRHVSGYGLGLHFVLLVGFDDTRGCFIAKNSWGTDWGDEGFFRISYQEVGGATSLGTDSISFLGAAGPEQLTIAQAVDAFLPFNYDSRSMWIGETGDTCDGTDSLSSNPVNGQADLSAEVKGPAKLSFMWKNNESSPWNEFMFSARSEEGSSAQELHLAGPTGWEPVLLLLGTGYHHLSWEFGPEGRGLIDQVRLEPPITVLAPNVGKIRSRRTYTVSWQAWPEARSFSVALRCSDKARWKRLVSGSSATSWDWRVAPLSFKRLGCLIRVTGYDEHGGVIASDKSDKSFTMVPR